MQEYNLTTWEEFEDALLELENCRKRFSDGRTLSVSDFLYRGQPNSEWSLETTLERFTNKRDITLTEYYEFAYAAKAKVETFTEKSWNIPTPEKYTEWIKKQSHISFINMPSYEFIAYLRHHGYPSPLLDWTASPYIALFFAFRNITQNTENVSIYVYLEYAGFGKVGSNHEAHIQTFGPYATIHQRHFLQQSSYTVCTTKDIDNFILANHELVSERKMVNQDLIWKFNLPSNEQSNVLKALNKMNINAYSLFLSVDSLMESTAVLENRFD